MLHRISNGDEEAFATLYRLHQPGIQVFFMRYLHAETLAEDLCQELFIKLWDNRRQLSEVREFRPYLRVLARNLALNSLKRISVSQRALNGLLAHYPKPYDTSDHMLLDREYNALLEEVLSRLPRRSREIFSLCREQGKSYNEVAKSLGISRNAIKNHMVSTLKVLKTFAEKQLGVTLVLIIGALSMLFPGN